MFNVLINEEYSVGVDIEWHQSVLEHAMSKKRKKKSIGYQNKV